MKTIFKNNPLLTTIDEIKRLESAYEATLRVKNHNWNIIKNNNFRTSQEAHEENKNAKQEIAAVNEPLASIEQCLFELRASVNADLVAEHKAVINAVKADINQLQTLLNDQRQTLSVASANVQHDVISDLIAQREELLADIALGNDKTSELTQLDAQIAMVKAAQLTTVADNQNIMAHVQQTMNGLNKRLSTAQEKLEFLQSYTPKIHDAYCMAIAVKSAIEFKKMTDAFTGKIVELIAMDSLISTLGQRKNTGLFYELWQLKIPFVGLDKPVLYCEVKDGEHSYCDSHSKEFNASIASALGDLKVALINQGIDSF